MRKSKERSNKLGEVFTSEKLVNSSIRGIPKKEFRNPERTFLDPACGNGNFLVEILKRKLANDHNPLEALSTIYGIDIMEDNVLECRERLLKIAGESEEASKIVKKNIRVADCLKIKNIEEFCN